jgi:Fe(II)/alpha-ketoglutarate-dependent arginine beta-hydroxylase
MDRLEIDTAERLGLTQLVDEIEDEFEDLESDEALDRITVLSHELPGRIRRTLNTFRRERMSGVLCISGYVVDQERVGRTPAHWRDRPSPSTTRREELLLILFSSLLGDPFGWATQQNGRLIHDVLPIKGHENEQLGSSSDSVLTWHTEDAFHPLRGDFIGFTCLRNPYAAATTIGYVDSLDLPPTVKDVLFENRFGIRPDESHLPKNNNTAARDAEAFASIDEMQRNPDLVAVLFGDPEKPYIRADPYFMTVASGDHEAQYALDRLIKEIDENLFDLCLADGDFYFLDNFRAVHGRKPFIACHDGTDRWLKRVNIACDLRKSRAARHTESPRSVS